MKQLNAGRFAKFNDTIYVGIDPGIKGGICFLQADGTHDIIDMPTLQVKNYAGKEKTIYHYKELKSIFKSIKHFEHVIAIEKQQTYPDDTNANSHKTGYQYGWFIGAFDIGDYVYEKVHPRVWQDFYFNNFKTGGTKQMSIAKATELYPFIDLTRPSAKGHKFSFSDGRSDAVLIAHWIMKTYNKRNNGMYAAQALYG
jgi:hypothetical protein